MASIKDVAEKAGVSKSTVSHVINKTRYVAPETVQKVLQTMEELNYYPSQVASSMRSKKSKTIGFVFPLLELEPFSMILVQGMERVLNDNGYNMVLCNSRRDLKKEKEMIQMLNSRLIDGLIISPSSSERGYYKGLIKDTYPTVFVDAKAHGDFADTITSDIYRGTNEAVSYLIEKGHTRIGLIKSNFDVTPNYEKTKGYRDALTAHHMAIDESIIKSAQATIENGYQLCKELVEQSNITALLIANYVMMIGAIKYLQEAEISIPDQMAVVGVEEYEWMQILKPQISVIKQFPYQLGETAAKVILERIQNPGMERKDYRLPTEFVLKGSC
ncbi:LacI family DNA-binding transcriptional regulator [Paenibacillus ehimensis]|uniref:LacI family DNA-binding transcriptional regulator n=1 Tax=Paenibacillus ehimensis TaxID=79264 RepID=A0ABT8V5X4_9BACL|nr:LacI family DNA-binding transcriptional regulator [Paenibacillus ehimensis]MDO3676831.1 LacI family DNA-binding transcriptional regulator [Paenibacillus ehimensis]